MMMQAPLHPANHNQDPAETMQLAKNRLESALKGLEVTIDQQADNKLKRQFVVEQLKALDTHLADLELRVS